MKNLSYIHPYTVVHIIVIILCTTNVHYLKMSDKGLAIIQQRYDPVTKKTWWGEIDPWLTDVLYLHPRFKEYFEDRASEYTDGLYPTVTIRQIVWASKIKPIPRERWETCFDRKGV